MSLSGLEQNVYDEKTTENVLVDSGALYYSESDVSINNLTESDFNPLGATQDGATFNIDTSWRNINIDGIKGNAKGSRVKDSVAPSIEANLLEFSVEHFQKAISGSYTEDWPSSTDATHDLVRRDCNIELADYINYVALVGYLGADCSVGGSGEPVVFVVENALSDGGFSFDMADESEAVMSVTFSGHYDPAEAPTEPWAILSPKSTTNPLLRTDSELVVGQTNPDLTLDLHYDDFVGSSEATDTSNWSFTAGDTGLAMDSVYYSDEDTVVMALDSTGSTDGTVDAGTVEIQALAAALEGSNDSEILEVTAS